MLNRVGIRVLVFLLISVMVFSLIPDTPVAEEVSPASAQGIVQATVIPDNLIVRQRPGVNAPVLGVFFRDTVLAVEGREDLYGNGGIWVYATPVDGGLTGWVHSDYLIFPSDFDRSSLPIVTVEGSDSSAPPPAENNEPEAEPTVEETPAPSIEVPEGGLSGSTRSLINFRSGPSTSTRIIRVLGGNLPVAFIGRNSAGTWLRTLVDGQEGWLYASLMNVNGNISDLPVIETAFDAPSGDTGTSTGVSVAPPQYSSANLGRFSYGAHVSGFSHPDLMSYAGMSWVKRQIRYAPGASPDGVAGIINEAHGRGFRILLGVVGYKNDVAAGGDGYFNGFADYVAGLARLGADAIEIWNEPNIDREWPNGQIDPAMYTRLLAASYNAIKAANPGTIVISGAPAPTGAEGAFGRAAVWNDDAYLQGMRNAGAANYMDCVGAHYNEGIVSPRQTSGDPRGSYYTRYFYTMVSTYYNIMRKPVCFTELGYLTPEGFGPLSPNFGWAANVTVAQQAQWVADAIRLGRADSRVALIIIWNMDFTNYGEDPMAGYALVRPNGTCPACDRLAGR